MFGKSLTAIAVGAVLSAVTPAQAATWLSAASDDEFAAQNASNPFTVFGTSTMQWGSSTTWELGIKDGTGRLTASSEVAWQPTNSLSAAGSSPLVAYTSTGKLTTTFVTGSCLNASGVMTACKYSKTGTVAKGADTLWIRAVMPVGAYSSTVMLTGLEIKYTGGTWMGLDFINANANGAYLGFSDPLLATGFTLRYSFGYFNNLKYSGGTYASGPAIPAFDFIVGKYATPLDPNQDPGSYSGDPAPYIDENLDMMAFETETAAVPEPASWALLIAGFGVVGTTLRRRRAVHA